MGCVRLGWQLASLIPISKYPTYIQYFFCVFFVHNARVSSTSFILGPMYDNEKENWSILTNKEMYASVKKASVIETIRLG